MKKSILSILFLATVAFTFQSCDKDDDGGGSGLNDTVTVDGTTYDLNNTGLLQSWGSNGNDSYNWIAYLSGSNNVNVYLDLNTDSAEGLVEGTYTYSSTRNAFTFYDAEISFGDDEAYYQMLDGTIEVGVNGNTISIEFDFIAEEDGVETPIEVEWSGTLSESLIED